jgi:hypothetical protein
VDNGVQGGQVYNEDVEEQRDDECRAPCDIPYCRIWCYSVLAYCVLMRMQKLSAHRMSYARTGLTFTGTHGKCALNNLYKRIPLE